MTVTLHPIVAAVTDRIRQRSAPTRSAYLARLEQARRAGPIRKNLSCTNLAHTFATSAPNDKAILREVRWPNLAIVSSYNDMLSAHQPLERFPALIKQAAHEAGAVAQFAGGVPAMGSRSLAPAWECRQTAPAVRLRQITEDAGASRCAPTLECGSQRGCKMRIAGSRPCRVSRRWMNLWVIGYV